MARYTLKYRPIDTFTLPRSQKWTLVEQPGGPVNPYWRRADLPVSRWAHGVVEVAEPYTADEVAAFELQRVD